MSAMRVVFRLLLLAVLSLSIPAQAFAAWSFPKFALRLPPGVTGSVGEMAAEGLAADGAGGITISGVATAITNLGPIAFTNPYTAAAAVLALSLAAWYKSDPAGMTAYMQSVGAVLSGLVPSATGYGAASSTFSMSATCPDGSAVVVGGSGGTVASVFAAELGKIVPLGSTLQDVVWNRVSDQVLLNALRPDGTSTVTGYTTTCASGADPTYTGVIPTPPPTVPATPAQVQKGVQDWLTGNPAAAAGAAQAAADAGFPPALTPPAGAVAGGPATVTGPATTSTSAAADGSKSTTTCTPTYAVTYGQASASLSGGNQCTTVATDAAGNTSTSTSSTSTAAQAASAPVVPASAPASSPAIGAFAGGSLSPYKASGLTWAGVIGAFQSTIAASGIGAALDGFFSINSVSATCPTWSQTIPYLDVSITFDQQCAPWALNAYAVFGAIALLAAAVGAFYVAFL